MFCRLSEPQAEMYKGICDSLKNVRVEDVAEIAKEEKEEKADKPSGKGQGGNQTLRCITALKKLCNHPELIYRVYQVRVRFRSRSCRGYSQATQEEEGNRELIEPVMHHLAPYGNFKTPMPELSGKMQFLAALLVQMRDTTDDRIVVVSNYTQVRSAIRVRIFGRANSVPDARSAGEAVHSAAHRLLPPRR